LAPTELFEVKKSVDELCSLLTVENSEPSREVRIAEAKKEIFTEYDSMLRELAK
jgi:hypothetical protein